MRRGMRRRRNNSATNPRIPRGTEMRCSKTTHADHIPRHKAMLTNQKHAHSIAGLRECTHVCTHTNVPVDEGSCVWLHCFTARLLHELLHQGHKALESTVCVAVERCMFGCHVTHLGTPFVKCKGTRKDLRRKREGVKSAWHALTHAH